jgi:hypothetical protein
LQDTSKLMLTAVAAGVLLGAGLSRLSAPVMKFAPEPDWRSRLQPEFSATPLQFVDSGPQDLRPIGWTQGLAMIDSVYTTQVAVPAEVGAALEEAKETATRIDAATQSYGSTSQQLPPSADARGPADRPGVPVVVAPPVIPADATFRPGEEAAEPFQ